MSKLLAILGSVFAVVAASVLLYINLSPPFISAISVLSSKARNQLFTRAFSWLDGALDSSYFQLCALALQSSYGGGASCQLGQLNVESEEEKGKRRKGKG